MAIIMETELGRCKLCGSPVRIVRRDDGAADHYEPVDAETTPPPPIPPGLDDFLRASRKGKRTVAIVGAAWSSRAWAPYRDTKVEIWSLNDMHARSGIDRTTRWFDMHPKWYIVENDKREHWGWLQEERDLPIYMLQKYDDIPSSIPYPLRQVQDRLLTRVQKGEEVVKKLFSSTISYMLALALYEDFERIELFGIELVMADAWAYQREAVAFWLGKVDGMGVEVWMPKTCTLFQIPLYGYDQIREVEGAVIPANRRLEIG